MTSSLSAMASVLIFLYSYFFVLFMSFFLFSEGLQMICWNFQKAFFLFSYGFANPVSRSLVAACARVLVVRPTPLSLEASRSWRCCVQPSPPSQAFPTRMFPLLKPSSTVSVIQSSLAEFSPAVDHSTSPLSTKSIFTSHH